MNINNNNNNTMLNNNMPNNAIYNLKPIGPIARKKWDKNKHTPNKPIQNASIPQFNSFNNNDNPNIGNLPNVNNINKNEESNPLRQF